MGTVILDEKYRTYFRVNRGKGTKLKTLNVRKDERNGYVRVTLSMKEKKVVLARKIMELELRRKLKKSEIVHHKNHNTLDNRISNLEVMDKIKHHRMHSTGENNGMYGVVGEKHPRWNRKKVVCNSCGNKFMQVGWRALINKKNFCNWECYSKSGKIHEVKA